MCPSHVSSSVRETRRNKDPITTKTIAHTRTATIKVKKLQVKKETNGLISETARWTQTDSGF